MAIASFFYLGGKMANSEESRSSVQVFPASEPCDADDQESVAKSLIEKWGGYDECPTSPSEAGIGRLT
jgi:hypothetical protein